MVDENNMDDKETKQILTEADYVKSLLMSDGWKSIYGKLQNRLLDLQNIHNLDMSKPETLPIQLASRTMAVQVIWDWLKQDVTGFVEQQENNTAKLVDKGIESFIGRE